MFGQAGAVALLSTITAFHLISAQPGYILTLPRTLRAGGEETFCVTLHDVDDPAFAFTLRLTHKETQEEHDFEYEISESYSQCLKFKVPTQTGEYDVVLRNDTSTIEATGTTEVEVKTENIITLVQTDKPIYKPGQRVQFRVLTLTRDLKTRTGVIQSIFIKTPNDIRVKQWLNVECQGVTSFKYPMPAEPTLGEWTIDVTLDGETTSQPFQVQEYVLPRFDVQITPPPFLLSNASTIDGKVCAEYTYGKPVMGYVSLEVCLTSYQSTERPCYRETVKFDGCYKFSVNTSEVEMANKKYYLYGSKLQINASVREINTAAVVNKTSTGPAVSYDPLKITLEDDTNGFFKPIFPYHGRAVVTTPDGKPAPEELIEVSLVDYRNDIRLSNNYTTDSDGIIHFSVCDIITEKTQDFSIDAKAVLYADPSTYYGLSNTLYMPRAYKTVKQWYSPSLSYIAIPRQSRTVSCGGELEVTVPYTTTLNTYTKFYYQVMSRGRILHTGHKMHHFLKHDSTEFLEVPMASCLQKVPDPSPPPEIGEGDAEEGGDEGVQKEGEAIEIVDPPAEMSAGVMQQGGLYQSLGVRRKRAPVIGELEQMRDGEEEEGEQMKHANKTREGNYTFEEGGDKHVHGADSQGNYTANDTSSQHERDDTHVEGDDGAAAHEEAGGDVVHDEGVGGDVHEEGGGGTLHEEAGGGTLHENAGGGSVHDEDAGGKVHDEGGGGAVHDEGGGGGAVHDKGGGGALGNYTLEESDPVHEGNNTHEVHNRREDGNNTHEVHSRREDGNNTHGEDEITLTDTNDTSEHTSDAREKMLPYNEGNRTQEEGNYTLESGKQTHEEGDHTRDDDVTRSDRLTNDGKVTVQPVKGALHKAVDKQANVSPGLGGEIQNDQSEGNENDTDVQDIDKSGTDNLTTHSDPSDHALSDVKTVGVGGNGSREGDGGDMGNTLSEMGNETSKEGQMNSKDNCSNVDADDLGNDDYGYDEYDEYDDDDDDDDDDYDEYDEDDRGRNQISEDIYGEEPIQAAIFRPFGLRRKRASGIAAEMAGNDLSDGMEGGEGGEEPPAGPTGPPPPPPPSRHVSHFTLRVPVTEEMSPEASLLIYYVRDDGETVADSINFDVEACFKNKVKFDFLEKKVIPGREATLRLQAEPGSLCSIGMIDKSINILGGDHQLTPEKMFDILKKYGNGREQYHYYKRDKEYCERKVNDEERTPEHEMYGEWWHYSSRYVDAVEAFRQMGMAVATNMLLETRPCSKEYAVLYEEGGLPGPGGGQRVLPLGIPLSAAQKKKPSGSVLRSYFPETWLWELEQVGDTGELELRKTTPHTITRWVGNTICTSQSAGVGVAPMTSLTTFQPFFLSIHLPYAAVRGERLPLHVTIFNYLEKCLYMQVNVETGDDITLTVRDHLKLPFCLCGGKSKTQSYYISAKEVGKLPIVARAEIVPGTCDNNIEPDTEYIGLSDAVKRELFVKVEGVTQEYTKSLYICPKDSDVTREEVELPLPDDIVRDSARGHVSVIGDIMGPALSNLDNLVQLPTGCGEQTMISFSPNIYVLKYLTFTSQLTDEMKLLCERYMEIGYTRELNYRHDDGSFSAFGKSDASGSTWLTAFVVKSFAQAQRFIYIDQTNLATSVSFLKSTRMENGCFREVGKVFSSYMMGGLGKVDGEDDTALTAFVVVALLEARVPRDDPVLMAALRCLSLQPRDEMDTYTLTLTAYAQTLNDPTSQASDAVMTELDARVISNGELGYWGRGGSMPDAVNTWHYRTAPSAEIEMTSYGLMATLLYYQDGGLAKGQPMIMWLSQQRNSLGGFASTQDTVLGLQAMAEFASKTFTGNATDLSVTFTGNKMSQTYDITTGVNTLLLQRAPIMHLPNTLSVSTNGTGCALIQANVQFNKLPENLGINKPLFNLTVAVRRSRTKRSDCARRSIRICVSFMGKKDFSAGMSMLTVKMVTAWTPVLNSLKELESVFPILSMKKYENDVKKGLIAFYFDELDVRKRCFEFELEQDRDVAVSDPKPAEIQAYQYYEKDVTIVKSYEINTTCGTKAEIPDETTAPTWLPGSPIEMQNRIGSLNDMPPLPSQKTQETTGCPACINEKPEDFDQLICQSKAIYKVQAGRNGRASMKIKADLRTRRKKKIDKFASFTLGSECQCDLLNPPNEKKRVRRLLILSNREQSLVQSVDPGSVGHMIHLGSSTIIINLDRNRKLEKETRKKARSCNRRS